MIKKKKILISGIGEILLERSPRAKHMNLSIRPFRGIRVAVPCGVSLESAEAFARSKTDWIMQHLPRLKAMEQALVARRQAQSAVPIDSRAAKARLIERLNELSQKHGLPYNRVFVKRQKTRWGSCSAKKNINLNIHLAALPEALMDYAIVHELVHTKILNHSRDFWEELEKRLPCALQLDRELRAHSHPPSAAVGQQWDQQ
ncbi:MAG: SprT family zinc-dependent metalloprotease [Desulfobacteraceae bacterium]|nr:SprT family zinc-dependent metalloprotease [Desulfobacteraceae bacterium]